jgi:hypothetical protein
LGTLAPDLRASLRAIATACFRLLTFLPLPDFKVPLLCSFMTLWILRSPLELECECEDFVATVILSETWNLTRRGGTPVGRTTQPEKVQKYPN